MATELQSSSARETQQRTKPVEGQSITVSRKIVYFQAALLGIIATTFFVFGMMVGTLTARNQLEPEIVDCAVSGKAVWKNASGKVVPDRGAVVLILPADKNPERRLNPKLVHPESFEPLDNDVIDTIHELGGAVVRANASGEFNVTIDSPARYEVVVISRNDSSDQLLSRKEMATLSTWFMPVEDVRTGKSTHFSALRVDATQKKLGEIRLATKVEE